MGKPLIFVWRLGAMGFALLCGAFLGAMLAIAFVADGGPRVWLDLLTLYKPVPAGEARGDWLLDFEWSVVVGLTGMTALAGCLLWAILVWRRRATAVAALALGFILGGLAGVSVQLGFAFEDASLWGRLDLAFIFGCIGAASGLATFGIDRLLLRWIRPERRLRNA